MNGTTAQPLHVTEDDSDNDSHQESEGSSNSRLDRMLEKNFPDNKDDNNNNDDDSPIIHLAIDHQAGRTTRKPTSSVNASQSSNPLGRGTVGMGVLMDALRRDAIRHAEHYNDALSNDGSIDSDDELELWAQQIRGEIRDSEMVELALEAQRAADAGEDHFVGHPSTFGLYPDTHSISSTKKLKPLERRRAYTVDTPTLMRMSPMRIRSERKKLRVLALRNITEVIPPINELHLHLRAHMLQYGVAPLVRTGLETHETTADRLQASPPAGILNSIKTWVSSKNSIDDGALSPNSGRLSSLLIDSDDEHSTASHTDYEVGDTLAEHKRKIHSTRKPKHVRVPSGLILFDYDVDGDDFYRHREKVNDHETLGTVPTLSSSELGRHSDEHAHTMTPMENINELEGRRLSGQKDPLPLSLDLETYTPRGDNSTLANTVQSSPGYSKEPPELPTLTSTPGRRERTAFGGLNMSNIGAWPIRDPELIPRGLLCRSTSLTVEEPFKSIFHHLSETGSVIHGKSSTVGQLALTPAFLSNQTGAIKFPTTSVKDFIEETIPVLAALEKVKSGPLDVSSDEKGPNGDLPVNISLEARSPDNSILENVHGTSYVDDGACSQRGVLTKPKTMLYLMEERSPLSPDGSVVMIFGRQEANDVEVALAESEKLVVEASFNPMETAESLMDIDELDYPTGGDPHPSMLYVIDDPAPLSPDGSMVMFLGRRKKSEVEVAITESGQTPMSSTPMLYLIDDTAPLSPDGSMVMFLGRQEKSEVEVAITESDQPPMSATHTQDHKDGATRQGNSPSVLTVEANLYSSTLGSMHMLPATTKKSSERTKKSSERPKNPAGEEIPLKAEGTMNIACCHEEDSAVGGEKASHVAELVSVEEQTLLAGGDHQALETVSVHSHAMPWGCDILSRTASVDSLTALPLIDMPSEDASPAPAKLAILREGDTIGVRRVTSCPALPTDHGEMQLLASPMSVKGTLDTPARVGCLGDHADSFRAVAMGVFMRMSPKREDHVSYQARDIGITPTENVEFLTNYLYYSKVGQEPATHVESHRFCGEPCGDVRSLDNACGILGSGCHGLSGVVDAATFIFPTKQPARDPLNLDPGTYRGSLHSETWFDAATERFDGAIDGAIERFVGSSTHAQSHTWHTFQAPSLKVKTTPAAVARKVTSIFQRHRTTEKVGGLKSVQGHRRRSASVDSSKDSEEVNETQQQWQNIIYSIPSAGDVLAVKRDSSPMLERALFQEP